MLFIQLSSNGQDIDIDDVVPVNVSGNDIPSQQLTTAEQIDEIMDHYIEVESNQRIRKENVNAWTLTFKQSDMEMKVIIVHVCIRF